MWQTVPFDVLACMHWEEDLLLLFVTSFFSSKLLICIFFKLYL